MRTISDVCVAHGLDRSELEDPVRFPDRRDVRGDIVNVRFAAIVLRLGDLLDMRCDRACPLLLNAACPLPADSLAHWTQYQRITHRLTAPDRIEIRAECHTQDEHRFLQDWCKWLVDEVEHAGLMMARSARHGNWKPPAIGLSPSNRTIDIRPAGTATYQPLEWRFELDPDVVFERLIHDVYDTPYAFIRELIQNALDASRCQMYADLRSDGIIPPDYPTQVAEERRQRYPVRVSLSTIQKRSALSGEAVTEQVIAVDDSGIGMDREIIERYLLQVGRSYYTTEDFRRSYGFVPTSRYGLGFLSVFAVSDLVTIETCKPTGRGQPGPLRVTLTGPRNYLLIERGENRGRGTRVEVALRERLRPGRLAEIVAGWCRRVEFPVLVDDHGTLTTIAAERPDQFVCEVRHIAKEGARFAIRSFPLNRPGIDGEVYVFTYTDEQGESWASARWARYVYPDKHPRAVTPELPGDLVCFHGIAVPGQGLEGDWRHCFGTDRNLAYCVRVDHRTEAHRLTIGRTQLALRGRQPRTAGNDGREVASRLEELLLEHLASTASRAATEGWVYRQRLIRYFPLNAFWAAQPETIRVYVRGKPRLVSLEDVQEMPKLTTVLTADDLLPDLLRQHGAPSEELGAPVGVDEPALTNADIRRLSDAHLVSIFERRSPSCVQWLDGGLLGVEWRSCEDRPALWPRGRPFYSVAFPARTVVGLVIHKTADSVYESVLLNTEHVYVQWLIRVLDACRRGEHGLGEMHASRLLNLTYSPLWYPGHGTEDLLAYLDTWRTVGGLPSALVPPPGRCLELDVSLAWRLLPPL